MAEYKVSVVIPAYRAEATIARAIDSVLAQPGVESEIIVVVDGAVDNTEKIARQYQDVTVLVNDRNRGAQYSRNRGLGHVCRDYVMFLDSDDYIEGPLLKSLAASLSAEEADIAFGPFAYEQGGQRWNFRLMQSPDSARILSDWLERGLYIGPAAILWRTQSVKSIGGWDAQIRKNQDVEIVLRALTVGLRPAVSREGLGIYWQHRGVTRVSNVSPSVYGESQRLINQRIKQWISHQTEPDPAIVQAFACYFYHNAAKCYRLGLDELGDSFLVDARALGLTGHPGRWRHRALVALLGLKRKQRLSSLPVIASLRNQLDRAQSTKPPRQETCGTGPKVNVSSKKG